METDDDEKQEHIEEEWMKSKEMETFVARLGVLETKIKQFEDSRDINKKDADSTRNAVLNLLQRCEPRIALIEEVLVADGKLVRNEKGELEKAPSKPAEPPKVKKTRGKKRRARNGKRGIK